MTPKEKAYIIHILAEARVDEKCKIIINRNNMNASDRAKADLEKIYTENINAIDKTLEVLDNLK